MCTTPKRLTNHSSCMYGRTLVFPFTQEQQLFLLRLGEDGLSVVIVEHLLCPAEK